MTIIHKKSSPRIEVSFGFTLNIGNYESVRFDGGISRDLEMGETWEEVMAQEFDKVQIHIMEKVDAFKNIADTFTTRAKVKKS